ncbi:MAG TPA: hypothetical protein VFH95_10960 [Candidatus Kapabacteria bacterium]|nr:hypothetical protein [Candidatus Kapabacteria bacterium]
MNETEEAGRQSDLESRSSADAIGMKQREFLAPISNAPPAKART